MAAVASETFTSTSAPIQHAAVRAFDGRTRLETYLTHSRRILGRPRRRLRASGCAGRGPWCCEPEGGFYLFPDFTAPDRALARAGASPPPRSSAAGLLEETGVAVLPGSDFGRPESELTARIAFVDFDGARALAASEQVPLTEELDADFLSTHCPQTMGGVSALCDWIVGLAG